MPRLNCSLCVISPYHSPIPQQLYLSKCQELVSFPEVLSMEAPLVWNLLYCPLHFYFSVYLIIVYVCELHEGK